MEMDSRSGFCIQPVPLRAQEFASPDLVSSQHTGDLGSRSVLDSGSPASASPRKCMTADQPTLFANGAKSGFCYHPSALVQIPSALRARNRLYCKGLWTWSPPPKPHVIAEEGQTAGPGSYSRNLGPGLHSPWRSSSGLSFPPMYYLPDWTPFSMETNPGIIPLGLESIPHGTPTPGFPSPHTSSPSINFLNS